MFDEAKALIKILKFSPFAGFYFTCSNIRHVACSVQTVCQLILPHIFKPFFDLCQLDVICNSRSIF